MSEQPYREFDPGPERASYSRVGPPPVEQRAPLLEADGRQQPLLAEQERAAESHGGAGPESPDMREV